MNDRWVQFRKYLEPIEWAPPMRRINGFGVILLGKQREIPNSQMFTKGYWLTLAFVPIFPFSFYVVSGGFDRFKFHAKISVWNFIRLYRWGSLSYFASVWVEAIFRAILVIGLMLAVGLSVSWIFSLLR